MRCIQTVYSLCGVRCIQTLYSLCGVRCIQTVYSLCGVRCIQTVYSLCGVRCIQTVYSLCGLRCIQTVYVVFSYFIIHVPFCYSVTMPIEPYIYEFCDKTYVYHLTHVYVLHSLNVPI